MKKRKDQEDELHDRRLRELEEVHQNNVLHLMEHSTNLKKKKDTQA